MRISWAVATLPISVHDTISSNAKRQTCTMPLPRSFLGLCTQHQLTNKLACWAVGSTLTWAGGGRPPLGRSVEEAVDVHGNDFAGRAVVDLGEQRGTFGRLEVQFHRVSTVVACRGDEAGRRIDIAAGADGDE